MRDKRHTGRNLIKKYCTPAILFCFEPEFGMMDFIDNNRF
jgi:hypothetical protein